MLSPYCFRIFRLNRNKLHFDGKHCDMLELERLVIDRQLADMKDIYNSKWMH